MIKTLLTEVVKDFKLLFRNWTMLLLLVLGPLFLILLVGYAFSGNEVHDISIGVITDDFESRSPLLSNVSDIGTIVPYEDRDTCIRDVMFAVLHICLEIDQDSEAQGFSGDVTFYYDPTRKRISLVIIDQLKAFFGLKAEEISLLSAQTLIGEVQELITFIQDNRGDIDLIQNESLKIRSDLIDRRAQLIAINSTFTPTYHRVRSTYDALTPTLDLIDNQSIEIENQTRLLQDQITTLIDIGEEVENSTTEIQNYVKLVNDTVPGIIEPNVTDIFVNTTSLFISELRLFNATLSRYVNSTNTTVSSISILRNDMDTIISQLDTLVTLLELEIQNTDSYIMLIDESNIRLQELGDAIDDRLAGLGALEPGLAEQIIKPITQRFKAIIPEPPGVQNIFPVLLSTMILFISLLFANIVSLLEIYNKAYIRNILAPVNDLVFMSGLIITNVIVVLFQVLVLLGVAQFQFGIEIVGHFWPIFAISFLLILIFVFVGMLIATITKSIQSSILLTTFTALVFFLFSDIVAALETMPVLASIAAGLNPVVLTVDIVRRILFFGQSISDVGSSVIILALYAAGLLAVLIIMTKRKNKRRF